MEKNRIIIDSWLNKKLPISVGKLLIIATLFLLVYLATKIGTKRNMALQESSENGLEIGGLIRKVKTELMKADTQRINNNEDALFALKDFSMEISFTVKSVNRGNAKIDYQVVTVEGGAETANEKVQKLLLHWHVIPREIRKLSSDDKGGDMIITPIDSIK